MGFFNRAKLDNKTLNDFVTHLNKQIPGFESALEHLRIGFTSWPCLKEEFYINKDVLDVGCGSGAAATLFLERGARFVWGIDPELQDNTLKQLKILPQTRFTKGSLSLKPFGSQKFDLVYAHFVTEHVYDLPRFLELVFTLLRPGGRFIALHGNFYAPLGPHDHGMINVNQQNWSQIISLAVPCWDSAAKCETSLEHRLKLQTRTDMANLTNIRLTPEDCSRCSYRHRSEFWGHLRYQDDYYHDFPNDRWRTKYDGSLNKVTPFLLRQYLIECNFQINTWYKNQIINEPPQELLQRFPLDDLITETILLEAQKPLKLTDAKDLSASTIVDVGKNFLKTSLKPNSILYKILKKCYRLFKRIYPLHLKMRMF